VRKSGPDNELNLGLGLNYTVHENDRATRAATSPSSRGWATSSSSTAAGVTYDLGRVKLNAIFVPRYGEYSAFAVFGFYFSVPLRH
jgi:hypothetical protein